MIPHLKGREKALEPFGWSPPEAEWVALVCLHSGLFTRAQFCAYFGSVEAPAWRKQASTFCAFPHYPEARRRRKL